MNNALNLYSHCQLHLNVRNVSKNTTQHHFMVALQLVWANWHAQSQTQQHTMHHWYFPTISVICKAQHTMARLHTTPLAKVIASKMNEQKRMKDGERCLKWWSFQCCLFSFKIYISQCIICSDKWWFKLNQI